MSLSQSNMYYFPNEGSPYHSTILMWPFVRGNLILRSGNFVLIVFAEHFCHLNDGSSYKQHPQNYLSLFHTNPVKIAPKKIITTWKGYTVAKWGENSLCHNYQGIIAREKSLLKGKYPTHDLIAVVTFQNLSLHKSTSLCWWKLPLRALVKFNLSCFAQNFHIPMHCITQ